MMTQQHLLHQKGEKYGDQLECIDTSVQPADVMTKDMEFDFLAKIMMSKLFDSAAAEEAKAGKQRKAEMRQARRQEETAHKKSYDDKSTS